MQPEAAVPIIRIPSHASTGKQYDTARVKNIPYGVLKSKAYDSVPVCYDCYRMYLYKDQQRMMQRYADIVLIGQNLCTNDELALAVSGQHLFANRVCL